MAAVRERHVRAHHDQTSAHPANQRTDTVSRKNGAGQVWCEFAWKETGHTPVYKFPAVDDAIAVAIKLFHRLVGRVHVFRVNIALKQESLAEVRCHLPTELAVKMKVQRAAAVNVEQVKESADLPDEGRWVGTV